MARDIDSDLMRGNVDTIILKSLSTGEKYGVEIAAFVEKSCNFQYVLKQPTLYGSLKRLEKQGLINSYWKGSGFGGRRHYYSLTELGANQLQKNKEDWIYSRTVIDHLISNQTIDLNLFEKKQSEMVKEEEKLNNSSNSAADELVLQKTETVVSAPAPTYAELTGNVSAPNSAANNSYASYINSTNTVKENKFLKYSNAFQNSTASEAVSEDKETINEDEAFASEFLNNKTNIDYGFESTAEDLLNYENILGETYYNNQEAAEEKLEEETIEQNNAYYSYNQGATPVQTSFNAEENSKNVIDENTSYITERITAPSYNNAQTSNFREYLVDSPNNAPAPQNFQPASPITNQSETSTKQEQTILTEAVKKQNSGHYVFASQSLGQYVNYNKLKFIQSIFVSIFMVAICLLTYYFLKSSFTVSDEGKAITIVCLILSCWFVIYRGVLYFLNPNAKKELIISWGATFFSKLLAIILSVILIFCLNIFMDLTLQNLTEHLDTIIMPVLLSTTFLFSTLVLYFLCKTKKFAA